MRCTASTAIADCSINVDLPILPHYTPPAYHNRVYLIRIAAYSYATYYNYSRVVVYITIGRSTYHPPPCLPRYLTTTRATATLRRTRLPQPAYHTLGIDLPVVTMVTGRAALPFPVTGCQVIVRCSYLLVDGAILRASSPRRLSRWPYAIYYDVTYN